jgi:hypothetical protein
MRGATQDPVALREEHGAWEFVSNLWLQAIRRDRTETNAIGALGCPAWSAECGKSRGGAIVARRGGIVAATMPAIAGVDPRDGTTLLDSVPV